MRKNNNISIGILGLWHLGIVYGASLASQGYKVYGFDLDSKVIRNLSNSIPPINEPGLDKLIIQNLNKNLFFTSIPRQAIKNKDYIFVTLDIPVSSSDEINVDEFERLVKILKKEISFKTIVVVSSQVPLGTCRKYFKDLNCIYFPENLRLGQAIDNFLNPERIILGSDSKEALEKFIKDFAFFNCPTFKMSLESAEMSKHALNSYLALNISFSSEIGDLCERMGADMGDVVKSLKTDSRVSPKAPINAGLGFAGGTLGRDIKTLISLSKSADYKPLLMEAVYLVNKQRLSHLQKRITKILGNIAGKRVGLLGLTYKPGTNTLRRSMSLELAKILNKKGANVRAFDPVIPNFNCRYLKVNSSLDKFFQDLDIIILMTEWPQFKLLKPKEAGKLMNKKIVFDTKNYLDKKSFIKNDFQFFNIGS